MSLSLSVENGSRDALTVRLSETLPKIKLGSISFRERT
jgi:hypothetical protein